MHQSVHHSLLFLYHEDMCSLLFSVLLVYHPQISDFLVVPTSASRGFHATGVKRMGGHGHDEPYYIHAKHMYNLHRMKHQGLKVTLSVLGAVSIGVGVPVYAVIFQQKKTASG